MRQVVAYKSLKTVENYKIVSTKSGHGRLRKVIVSEKLRLKDFDWENFGVLDWWSSLTRDGRTLRSIQCTLSPVLLPNESSLYRRKGRTIRKVMEGRGIFEPQKFFSSSNSLYEFFLGHSMNIF